MSLDRKLISLMTTPEGMAEVAEAYMGWEVFEEPLSVAAFNFGMEYWERYGQAPTVHVIETQFPGMKLKTYAEEVAEEGATTGWMIGQLQKRFLTNQGQTLLRSAAKDLAKDPAEALRTLQEDTRGVLDHAGKVGAVGYGRPGFEEDVSDEMSKLRVREEARRRLAAEKEGATEPFDAGMLRDILGRPPEPPFRVEGLSPSEAGTLIVAQRKTGKTTLTLNLARSLLTGQRFLGRFEVRPVVGSIAFLNFEVSGPQLARWADDVGVPQDRLFLVNLRGCRNPLSHPDDRGQLAALLREQKVECVIVDPFGRAYGGTSQNDSGEVGAWLTALDRFVRAEVGALDLILTTHAGWNAERTRGSSALEDWADSVVTMTRGSDKDEDARYLRAIGRDVHLDEDQLHFDPNTRLLSLTGTGSRNDTRRKAKAVRC